MKKLSFKKSWIAVGNQDLWQQKQYVTYVEINPSLLPELPYLPQNTNDFSWLVPLDLVEEFSGYASVGLEAEDTETVIKQVDQLEQEAQKLGMCLPSEFMTFMQNRLIHANVPSSTACFLDLSEHLIQLTEDTYALRFLCDQQSCVMWYLYFQQGICQGVLASPYFLEHDLFEHFYGEDELSYEEALAEAMHCADSFQIFMYRFWLENSLWFALYENKPLTQEQQQYMNEAKQKA